MKPSEIDALHKRGWCQTASSPAMDASASMDVAVKGVAGIDAFTDDRATSSTMCSVS